MPPLKALKLDTVSIRLGDETVVSDVSAELIPGKLYIMVGPNGAGKSTLLKAMDALLPLQGGCIALNGQSVHALSPAQRAEQIAYLPQDRSIAWDLSCVEVAALGAQNLNPDLARQKGFAELQALGLQEVSDRGVFSLSGGQRARVLLARVLASPAQVLVLDEPLIALDPAWQRQVLIRLKQRAAAGQTVVLSLHDLHLAAQFADEILLMHKGRLEARGQVENVFTSKCLSDVFQLKGEMSEQGGQRTLQLAPLPVF